MQFDIWCPAATAETARAIDGILLLIAARRVMHFTLGNFKPWAWYTLWVIDQVCCPSQPSSPLMYLAISPALLTLTTVSSMVLPESVSVLPISRWQTL